jgi:hypothetical protein
MKWPEQRWARPDSLFQKQLVCHTSDAADTRRWAGGGNHRCDFWMR